MATAKVLDWNGRDVPAELHALPPGRYTVEPVEEDWALTPEQEAGIEEALASIERGEGIHGEVVAERLRQRIAARRPK